MNNNSCGGCAHYRLDPLDSNNFGAPRQGECRCNPPQMIGIPTQHGLQMMVMYPKMPQHFHACGHHEAVEVKSKPLSILSEG